MLAPSPLSHLPPHFSPLPSLFARIAKTRKFIMAIFLCNTESNRTQVSRARVQLTNSDFPFSRQKTYPVFSRERNNFTKVVLLFPRVLWRFYLSKRFFNVFLFMIKPKTDGFYYYYFFFFFILD